MGAYVYGILSSQHRPVNGLGEVHLSKFIYKPYSTFSIFEAKNPNARWEGICRRIDNAWGDKRPQYIVIGDDIKDGFKEGAFIYSRVENCGTSYCDESTFGHGRVIGFLTRINRGWGIKYEHIDNTCYTIMREGKHFEANQRCFFDGEKFGAEYINLREKSIIQMTPA